jgi:hypothetical protein
MLFTESLNSKAEEIRQYISVNSSISFTSLLPYIESAEAKYIKPILGTEQYTELCNYYSDPTGWDDVIADPKTESAFLANLLKLVQKSLINLAFLDGFPVLSINLGDTGAYRKESENQKSLYQYQEENLKNSLRSEGFDTLDTILEFIEENISDFPIFEASETCTTFRSKFIRTASEFSEIYHIKNSRLVFLHLQSYIDLVMDFDLKPILGRYFIEELQYILSTGADHTDNQAILFNFIKKIQAYLSISKGMASLGVDISYNGAYFHSTASSGNNNKKIDSVKSPDLHHHQQNAANVGYAYIDYMKDFLHANIGDFPTYAAFNAYNQGDELGHRDNTNKKTFWA